MLEIETKIINFDDKAATERLKAIGAEFDGNVFFRRWTFDLTKKPGEDEFIRVRTDGKRTTLTYKFRKGSTLANTEEVEVEVEDFEKTATIMSKLCSTSYYAENRIERWSYRGVEITLNRWPKIPPVIEVEGGSEPEVKAAVNAIQMGEEIGNVGWETLYRERYHLELHSFKVLKFQ